MASDVRRRCADDVTRIGSGMAEARLRRRTGRKILAQRYENNSLEARASASFGIQPPVCFKSRGFSDQLWSGSRAPSSLAAPS
jgi:hypothetical protein